jgi:hypothetical protein
LIEILEYIANEMNGVNETIHYKKPSLEHIFPQNAKEKE